MIINVKCDDFIYQGLKELSKEFDFEIGESDQLKIIKKCLIQTEKSAEQDF